MISTETILWYISNIGEYTLEMLPCMCVSLIVFLIIRPHQLQTLQEKGVISTKWRESILLLFVLFLTGLAALTLFPANFWPYTMEYLFSSETRTSHFEWERFYPVLAGQNEMNLQLQPFLEIKRAFKGPWVFFIMLGNIGIFMPIGFFSALLWRKPRWWRSVLIGFGCSFLIEFVQLFIGRCADIDDIILNTTGALLGYWFYRILNMFCHKFFLQFQCCKKGEKL